MTFTCRYCTYTGTEKDFEVDHITPTSRGGSDEIFNKQIICSGCNRQKGDMTDEEYVNWRASHPYEANYGPTPNQ